MASVPWLIHFVYCILHLLHSLMMTCIWCCNEVCFRYAEPKLLLFIRKVHNGMNDVKIIIISFAVLETTCKRYIL